MTEPRDGRRSEPSDERRPDPEAWDLTVTGAVAEPLTLPVAELRSLAFETTEAEVSCQSVSAAESTWRGVRAGVLLERARPREEAAFGLVRAAGGDFACSFALDRLADALLAVERDGAPIPADRGGPVRLLPGGGGADCWEQLKWVSRIEVRVDEPVAADTAAEIALGRSDEE
ncbi:MAG: molybdopterin-dependent oxidoreductase [Haloferacaceae archaeon]